MDPVSTSITINIITAVVAAAVSGSKIYDYLKLKEYLNEAAKEFPNIKNFAVGILRGIIDHEINKQINKRNDLVFTVTNAGIVRAVVRKTIIHKENSVDREQKDFNLTIAGMLFGAKAKQAMTGYLFIGAAAIIHILYAKLGTQNISSGLLLFLSLCFALIHINQKILEFRIERGLYGKNEYEAREMISYLLNHSDKSDFSDGDSLKKLFPKPKEAKRAEALDAIPEIAR